MGIFWAINEPSLFLFLCFGPWRLAEQGYHAEKKITKNDPTDAQKKKRLEFVRLHAHRDGESWKNLVQGCGDFKDFTYYPKQLRKKFKRLRASWTYMRKSEKRKTAFLRPKKWFDPKDWKNTRKQKVFGLTTSTGKMLTFMVGAGKPWTAEKWAKKVDKRLGPFLKRCYPERTSFTILLDGEKLLRAPPAQRAYRKWGIRILPKWPGYSADLNPQENVWSRAEPQLRKLEKPRDTFETFGKNVIKAVNQYSAPEKLIASLAKRCRNVIKKSGGMVDKDVIDNRRR